MAVRYIRVKPIVDLFSPVLRATGNLAIVGAATKGADNIPVQIVDPSTATATFGDAFVIDPTDPEPDPAKKRRVLNSALTASLQLAFQQSPGPSQVWGIKSPGTATGPPTDPTAALAAAENLDVQLVVLAFTPLTTASAAATGAISALANHVVGISNTAGDGKERMGVAMLTQASTDATLVSGTLADDRMVYVAHQSSQDAAAAVAGTIAGYDPSISMLLKQVAINSAPFTSAQIDALNGSEIFGSGPAGKGVNWLTTPTLIPGGGVYLGEGYTGNPAGKKYIDVARFVDDSSFKIKARLIRSVGSLRISRVGLRSLVVQVESVLNPMLADGAIDRYDITIPVLNLLDADPAALTPAQLQAIQDAQAQRVVEVLVSIEYAGAMHRIDITLKFD